MQGTPLVVDHGGEVEGNKVRVKQVEEVEHVPAESADILAPDFIKAAGIIHVMLQWAMVVQQGGVPHGGKGSDKVALGHATGGGSIAVGGKEGIWEEGSRLCLGSSWVMTCRDGCCRMGRAVGVALALQSSSKMQKPRLASARSQHTAPLTSARLCVCGLGEVSGGHWGGRGNRAQLTG